MPRATVVTKAQSPARGPSARVSMPPAGLPLGRAVVPALDDAALEATGVTVALGAPTGDGLAAGGAMLVQAARATANIARALEEHRLMPSARLGPKTSEEAAAWAPPPPAS